MRDRNQIIRLQQDEETDAGGDSIHCSSWIALQDAVMEYNKKLQTADGEKCRL